MKSGPVRLLAFECCPFAKDREANLGISFNSNSCLFGDDPASDCRDTDESARRHIRPTERRRTVFFMEPTFESQYSDPRIANRAISSGIPLLARVAAYRSSWQGPQNSTEALCLNLFKGNVLWPHNPRLESSASLTTTTVPVRECDSKAVEQDSTQAVGLAGSMQTPTTEMASGTDNIAAAQDSKIASFETTMRCSARNSNTLRIAGMCDSREMRSCCRLPRSWKHLVRSPLGNVLVAADPQYAANFARSGAPRHLRMSPSIDSKPRARLRRSRSSPQPGIPLILSM